MQAESREHRPTEHCFLSLRASLTPGLPLRPDALL